MKTTKLLLTLAVVAVVTASMTPLKAAESFLSPRARDNQIRSVPGMTEEKLDRANLFKPKFTTWGNTVAQGTDNGRDLVRESRGVTASPRALANFPEFFKPTMRPATAIAACCKTMTKAECGMACCMDTGSKCGGTCCKS